MRGYSPSTRKSSNSSSSSKEIKILFSFCVSDFALFTSTIVSILLLAACPYFSVAPKKLEEVVSFYLVGRLLRKCRKKEYAHVIQYKCLLIKARLLKVVRKLKCCHFTLYIFTLYYLLSYINLKFLFFFFFND